MHVGHRRIDDVGPLLAELVDDVGDRPLVAGNRGGADDDHVPPADDQLVGGGGHAGQAAHGSSLAAGGDDADLVVFVLAHFSTSIISSSRTLR